ncbi:hypothetical protein MITS9508_02839 [Synechococcus sp. MIT S9508]|nr:hypothetical protein MITS9508_02839 [Synechococcus sp. MIT S9508]
MDSKVVVPTPESTAAQPVFLRLPMSGDLAVCVFLDLLRIDLPWPHFNNDSIYCFHAPLSVYWNDPLRLGVFVPLLRFSGHQNECDQGFRLAATH